MRKCYTTVVPMDVKYIFDFFSIALIALLGAMSPGPDFAIVTRYALSGSRRAAIYATLGISAAILIHVTYCALGIAILLVETPLLFRILQGVGSLYLGYLGIQLLWPARKGSAESIIPPVQGAFKAGFICNLLNPKATLFIFGIFTLFVSPEMPLIIP